MPMSVQHQCLSGRSKLSARVPGALSAQLTSGACSVDAPRSNRAQRDAVTQWSRIWSPCAAPGRRARAACLPTATSLAEAPDQALPPSPAPPGVPKDTDTSEAGEWEAEMEELLKLVALLPPSVRALVEEHPQMPVLLEVVMDLGRPPIARFPDGDVRLGDGIVSAEDLELAVSQVGHFGGDNRAGIDRTLHRISCIRNRSGRIIGLTCRVGRAIRGSASLVADLVVSGASILFLGRPGVGKTTAIREVSRALADELQKRVVIVDTSNEIGGDGDVPHDGIGRARRIQVPHPEQQHRVMIEAVENHMPQVVVIDEIGTEAECAAARTIAQRGVQLVATAHGNELENVVKNPALADLIGGIQSVTLGDEEARKRGVQKSILERAGPPTFDVAVEILERQKWRVHLDVAHAVDLLLAGGSPGGQVRERGEGGVILKYKEDPAVSGAAGRPARDFASRDVNTSSGGSGVVGTAKAAKAAAAAALAAQEAAAAAAASAAAAGSTRLPRGPGGGRQQDGSSSPNVSSVGSLSSFGEEDVEDEAGPGMASTAGGGSFVKRSVLGSIEAAADAADGALGDDGVPTQKGAKRLASRQALLGVQPQEVVLRLFPYELDVDKLWEVLSAMELTRKVLIVRHVAQADAVLGVRVRVKGDAALRQAAKAARVPIYAIKASGTSNLVRALRTLLGVDPSAGGMFVRSGNSSSNLTPDASKEGLAQEGAQSPAAPRVVDSAGEPAISGARPRAELDIAAVRAQLQDTPPAAPATSGRSRQTGSSPALMRQALEEARAACEQIVGPLQQPVELLPRTSDVVEGQVQLVTQYEGLGYEVLKAGNDMQRLRVLPRPG